jgi:hypothetical protein
MKNEKGLRKMLTESETTINKEKVENEIENPKQKNLRFPCSNTLMQVMHH